MYNLYRDAFNAYKRCRLQVMILEYLATEGTSNTGGPVTTLRMAPYIDKSLMWKADLLDIRRAVNYLEKLEYIEYDEKSETISISQGGIDALKDGTIQNLANNAFGGLVSIRIQFFCIAVSLIALIISILK